MENKRKVVFLDFDGVLNSAASPVRWHGLDMSNTRHLNRIIIHTKCSIVISSSWRSMVDMDFMKQCLEGAGFLYPDYIIGSTPVTQDYVRGREIEQWRIEHEHTGNYVILDDCENMLEEQQPFYVQTSFDEGLTRIHADRAIEILNAGMEEQ